VIRAMEATGILLFGRSASGKTTLAECLGRLLARGMDVELVRFDELRKGLTPVGTDPFSRGPRGPEDHLSQRSRAVRIQDRRWGVPDRGRRPYPGKHPHRPEAAGSGSVAVAGIARIGIPWPDANQPEFGDDTVLLRAGALVKAILRGWRRMLQAAIMLLGVGRTGKSTTAHHLTANLRELGYDPWLVRFDEFRKGFAPPGADPFSADPRIKQFIYSRVIGVFNDHLATGGSLIIDGGLSSERIRQQLKKEVAGLWIVHLYCPLWLAIVRDTKRSLARTPHERGWYLHLCALRDLLNPFLSPADRFPQPANTYPFEYPASADLHISTFCRQPTAVADEIVNRLGVPRRDIQRAGQVVGDRRIETTGAPTPTTPLGTLHERLEHGKALLEIIDRKRNETGLPIGQNVERIIIERELNELSEGSL